MTEKPPIRATTSTDERTLPVDRRFLDPPIVVVLTKSFPQRHPIEEHPMPERIYTSSKQGKLEALAETPFSSEDELQALIAKHPELLDGEQIRPGDARRWLLIAREKGIAASSGEGARWAVDLLLVDQDAMPTLVEVKRGRIPRYGVLSSGRSWNMRRMPPRPGRRTDCAARLRRRPALEESIPPRNLQLCCKRMASPAWMASGMLYRRTSPRTGSVCCSLPTN